jgi:APA family basic amino acid/polyamine antiporter
VAITSVVLTILFGNTRVAFAMSRDGLLPKAFSRVNAGRHTPALVTAAMGGVIAILAALVPLSEIAKLINIGTLFAFLLVNIGVIILRRTKPDLERGFRVPLVPVVPIIGSLLCIYLMTRLEAETWLRFAVWMAIGLVIYFAYGRSRSRLRANANA